MSAKQKKRRTTSRDVAEEPKASVVVTVGWMLGALATFGAEFLGVVLRMAAWINESMPEWLYAITDVLFLVALMSGVFTLLMTVICHAVRPTPPPKPVTRMVLAIAAVPLLVFVAKILAV